MKKIKVLGTEYTIIELPQIEMRKKCPEAMGFLYGLCDQDNLCIYLSDDLTKREYRETLIHELVHCFFQQSGLATQCPYALCEENVDWISIQLPKMFEACKKLKLLDEDKKEKKKDDIKCNSESVATSTVQEGYRSTNKYGTKILR